HTQLTARYPNSCGISAHRAIAPTKRLLAAARRAGIPIFYCTQETRPQNRPKGARSTRQALNVPPDGYAIYHEFTPQPEDVIITKQRASIFQGTPLFSHLSLLGIQSLIVCGESTSGCARASAVDGYSSGFHISLVEECTFDRAELTHKVNLFDLHHKYADVMHIDEIVAHLEGLKLAQAAGYGIGGAPRAEILFGILLAAASLLPGAASAQSVSFAGKQIKILIGFSPTGF